MTAVAPVIIATTNVPHGLPPWVYGLLAMFYGLLVIWCFVHLWRTR